MDTNRSEALLKYNIDLRINHKTQSTRSWQGKEKNKTWAGEERLVAPI
jgi:hypothetical protein